MTYREEAASLSHPLDYPKPSDLCAAGRAGRPEGLLPGSQNAPEAPPAAGPLFSSSEFKEKWESRRQPAARKGIKLGACLRKQGGEE